MQDTTLLMHYMYVLYVLYVFYMYVYVLYDYGYVQEYSEFVFKLVRDKSNLIKPGSKTYYSSQWKHRNRLGEKKDIPKSIADFVVVEHPMISSKYKVVGNNCQVFVINLDEKKLNFI